jgi:NAD(P)-dependent dehydrogenase (short-subunit alcohol dehydrogenase family)
VAEVAIITGGGNGIGRAVALRFAAAGIAVEIADWDEAAAKKTCEEITSTGGKAAACRVDVRSAADVKTVVARVVERHGRLDILVNIAGGAIHRKRVEDLSWAEWREVLDINLKGTFLFCREAAPIMTRQKRGRIVNTASNYGVTGSALRSPYSAAKAGIIGFSKSLALEFAPYKVLVNVVAPGPTDTPRVLEGWDPELRAKRAAEIPLGRNGTPEDMAEAFYFLTTSASACMTGQTLHVNGGWVTP